jgi:hypothetical protein
VIDALSGSVKFTLEPAATSNDFQLTTALLVDWKMFIAEPVCKITALPDVTTPPDGKFSATAG